MKVKYFAWMLAATLTAACSSDDENTNANDKAANDQEAASTVLGLTAEQQALVTPLNSFSVDLFQQLSSRAGGKSAVVSPLSAAIVLGMVDEGAAGQTADEIAAALGMAGKQKEAVSGLFAQYLSAIPAADAGATAAFANNVSVSDRFQLNSSYQKAMEDGYQASVLSLDFSSPSATATVNSWCGQHTRGLIPTIVDQLSEGDMLCLLNAIYFKAPWSTPFSKDASLGQPFAAADGQQLLKMMARTDDMQYCEQQGVQALRLPLGEGAFAMTVVLPPSGQSLDAFVRSLTADALSSLTFATRKVDAIIPIFSTTADTNLVPLLESLGVKRMFTVDAELPVMVSGVSDGLYVSLMKQKTRLGIDEEGCEGAAATLAELSQGANLDGGVQKATPFHATRPFVYYLSEVQSGTILFMGQFCGD